MKFGIMVTNAVNPAVTPASQADYVTRLSVAAEEAGFDSIWVADRTVFPVDIAERYPEMFGPHHSEPESQKLLEAMTTLSFVAGITTKVRLGFSVLVLPFRHPILNAKMVTSLDALSRGRAILGVGIGWMKEEFEGMGASYADRAAVTDEHVEMFKVLCTQETPEYRGKHFSISGKTFFPRPVQQPHVPIWVGGKTDAALRRAARLGDCWNGIFLTPDELAEKRETLKRLYEENGRDPASVETALTSNLNMYERKTSGGERVLLTGSPTEITDDLRRYVDAGLDHVLLSVSARSTDATIDCVRRLADEVVPRV